MTREADLIDAIRNAPDDDGPRLVYADWLMERGDPRGELIALQVALATLPDEERTLDPRFRRMDELRAAHLKDWIPRTGADVNARFERGMLEYLSIDPRTFLRNKQTVIDAFPLARNVRVRCRLQRREVTLTAIESLPSFPLLRTLELEGERAPTYLGEGIHYGDDIARTLVATALPRLTWLRLHSIPMKPETFRALAELAPRIESLSLVECDVDGAGLAELASASWPKLHSLTLRYGGTRVSIEHFLARAPALRRISAEARPTNPTNAADALADWDRLGDLEWLSIGCPAHALARAPRLPRSLEVRAGESMPAVHAWLGQHAKTGGTLELAGFMIEDSLVRELARSNLTRMPRLQGAHALSDAGVAVLAESPVLERSTRLELGFCSRVGNEGAFAIARSPRARGLKLVDVTETAVGIEGVRALAALPSLVELRAARELLADAQVSALLSARRG